MALGGNSGADSQSNEDNRRNFACLEGFRMRKAAWKVQVTPHLFSDMSVDIPQIFTNSSKNVLDTKTASWKCKTP